MPPSFEVTHRSVLAIAVPMTLAYLTTPLLGLVDTAVIGRLGDAALLGGLAAGAVVFDIVFTTCNFLRSGTTGLVAQAFGRGDAAQEQAIFWRAAVVALALGLLLAMLAPLWSALGQAFMAADAKVSETLDVYVRIRLLGAPLALLNYVVLGYVLGRGESALGLLLQVVLNGVNIVFALLLGLELGYGVAGVACATIIGEGAALALGAAVLLRRFARRPRLARAEIFAGAAYRRLMMLNGDIMIRSFTLLAAFALFARQGAQFGTVTLAANGVLMNLFLATAFFLDGFATAAEQLAGRAVGAADRAAFDAAVRLCVLWGFALAGALALALIAGGARLIGALTTQAEVQALALAYLPVAAATAVTAVLAFQMDGVFIGATWSRDMRNMMVLSLASFVVAVFALRPMGNMGLWLALHIFMVVRGVSLYAALRRRAPKAFAA